MLKSCSRCGGIHERKFKCQVGQVARVKDHENLAVKFRNSQVWKKKRKDILIRDKGLCQLCIRNLYETFGRAYNHKLIEVHHIEPIKDNFDLRLDDGNLISLCTYHHKRADRGEIPREELRRIINK
ncbi:HNH endonuclease [Clostridium chromiireducens]|uniref:HNH endonuclease n=1 Tax=Clostridium chromiireducens TaxID=225345 RepID=UPI003AF5A971